MQEHCILASIANMIRNPCETSRNVTNRGLEAAEMQVLKGGHQLRQMGRAARMARGARARAFKPNGSEQGAAAERIRGLQAAFQERQLHPHPGEPFCFALLRRLRVRGHHRLFATTV